MVNYFNPFLTYEECKNTYKSFIDSYHRFKNPEIEKWVRKNTEEGHLLWREPFLHISRTFSKGKSLQYFVDQNIVEKECLRIFRDNIKDKNSPPVLLYQHQSEAIFNIAQNKNNTIVATGTGSGKSFCFGIPIISECLKMKKDGIRGIKAVIVYPMNALANSQYEDFAARLEGSGLTIAIYTGDTLYKEEDAQCEFKQITGREYPYDSELISREMIKQKKPDILLTNYQMLELILTRFEDKELFPLHQRGVFKFLVLDEIHSYSGRRGADVACLIRRLKWHTGTMGKLICIGTSATIQSGEGEDSKKIMAKFASKIYGEEFKPEYIIGESYENNPERLIDALPDKIKITEEDFQLFDGSTSSVLNLSQKINKEPIKSEDLEYLGEALKDNPILNFIEKSLDKVKSLTLLIEDYQKKYRPNVDYKKIAMEVIAGLLVGSAITENHRKRFSLKLHTFFSQGRGIKGTIEKNNVCLSDRGDTKLISQNTGKEMDAFQIVFCQACGQEYYYGAKVGEKFIPQDINSSVDEEIGESGYLMLGHWGEEEIPLPDSWITVKGNVKKDKIDFKPQNLYFDNVKNKFNNGGEGIKVTFIPEPFMFCPNCGIDYDKRSSEYNKLRVYGRVGRATANDVLVSKILENLPQSQQKVIVFTDNRQDTAFQSGHLNDRSRRLLFRCLLYNVLKEKNAIFENYQKPRELISISDAVEGIIKFIEKKELPINYKQKEISFIDEDDEEDEDVEFGEDNERKYIKHLEYCILLEISRNKNFTQQNLEDVGLLKIVYRGLKGLASEKHKEQLWSDIPEIYQLSEDKRYDLLWAILTILRRRSAMSHELIINTKEANKIKKALNEEILFYISVINKNRAFGVKSQHDRYKDIFSFTHPLSTPARFAKRFLGLKDNDRCREVMCELFEILSNKVDIFKKEHVKYFGEVYRLNWERIKLAISINTIHKVSEKSNMVYDFKVYTKSLTSLELSEKDFQNLYYRNLYAKPIEKIIIINAQDHSGQLEGSRRKEIEYKFREKKLPNVLICTPTMELGIDIGNLNSIFLRNIPPNPSNYAQRAGRAGRKGQPSLITAFCGAGFGRGPHDQYFFKYPSKIIAGKVSTPRFLINNERLIASHIRSVILESLDCKLKSRPKELINLNSSNLEIFTDIKENLKNHINNEYLQLLDNIKKVFVKEMKEFDWFNEDFVIEIIKSFVDDFNKAFNVWRRDYQRLDEDHKRKSEEQRKQYKYGTKYDLDRIANQMEKMREGEGGYYVYRYLGDIGFLPGYAFPENSTNTKYFAKTEEKKIVRNRILSLREFAPFNTIYVDGGTFRVMSANSMVNDPWEKIKICPKCKEILTDKEINQSACPRCGNDLSMEHAIEKAMPMPDMIAISQHSINSDEEERLRSGYIINTYYNSNIGKINTIEIKCNNNENQLSLSYEHNGEIISINEGSRKDVREGRKGFGFCGACKAWIIDEDDKIKKHYGGYKDKNGKEVKGTCFRKGKINDYIYGVHLISKDSHDVLTINYKVPENIEDKEIFAKTLMYAINRALQLTLDLDSEEIDCFLRPSVKEGSKYEIILFETVSGGTGALESLLEKPTFNKVIYRACELLHMFDKEEESCDKACYDCLCSFYNQRDHSRLDRKVILPFLKNILDNKDELEFIKINIDNSSKRLGELKNKCSTNFERSILDVIFKAGLKLPDNAQKIIYDGDAPKVKPDFFYKELGSKGLCIFADGPEHEKEGVKQDDNEKRRWLKGNGYRVLIFDYKSAPEFKEEIEELKARL